MEYKRVKLKELCSVNQGLQIPISERFKEPGENRFFYITIQFLKGDSEKYYIENPSKSVTCGKEDILVVRTGNTGQVITGVEGCFHNNFFKVIPNDKVYSRYLYYVLTDERMYKKMVNVASGTTILDLKHSAFYDLDIPLPNYDIQIKITQILDKINRKIEINNQINNNLQKLLQELFRRWFVDFEFPDENGQPYKSSGGKMIGSELGEIPEEWRNGKFDDFIIETNKRVGEQSNEDVTIMSPIKTGELVKSEDFFSKQVYSKDISKYKKVEYLDYAYNPARINIGSIGIMKENIIGAVSPVYVTFKTKDNFQWYLYMLLDDINVKNKIVQYSSGSVRQALTFDSFSRISCIVPNKNIVEKYNKIYKKLQYEVKKLSNEILVLEKLRNTLLPKLINWKIDLDKIKI